MVPEAVAEVEEADVMTPRRGGGGPSRLGMCPAECDVSLSGLFPSDPEPRIGVWSRVQVRPAGH